VDNSESFNDNFSPFDETQSFLEETYDSRTVNQVFSNLSSPNRREIVVPENPFDHFDPPVAAPVALARDQQVFRKAATQIHHDSPRSIQMLFPSNSGEQCRPKSSQNIGRYPSHEGHNIRKSASSGCFGVTPDLRCDARSHEFKSCVNSNRGIRGTLSMSSAVSITNPQFVIPLTCHGKTLQAPTEKERVMEMASKLENGQLKRKCTGARALIGNPKSKLFDSNDEDKKCIQPDELEIELQKLDLLRSRAPGGLSVRKILGNPKMKPDVKKVMAENRVIL